MTSQQIDAEALYQSLVAQLRTRMAEGHAWSVAGIVSGGAWIAKRLAHDLGLPEYGVVNVAMHRDDYAKKGLHAKAQPTTLTFDVNERRILLVDDVLASAQLAHRKFFDTVHHPAAGRTVAAPGADCRARRCSARKAASPASSPSCWPKSGPGTTR